MNKILSYLFALTVLVFSPSKTVASHYDDEVQRGNQFIDNLLNDMVHENGHEYDPYALEESSIGFSKKVLFVNVSGEAKLHNGYINGLTTLHRPDYCIVKEENGRLNVNADLGAGVLQGHYDGTVKFMQFGPTISVNMEIKYVEIHMEFSVDSKTGRDGTLDKFLVDDMKGMTVEITGLGPMNWAANYLVSAMTTIFRGFIVKALESKVRSHVAERLPNYVFPVDDTSSEVPDKEPPETLAKRRDTVALVEDIYKQLLSDLKNI